MKIVEVIWTDTGQQMASTWVDPGIVKSRAAELITSVHSTGFLLDETDTYILLAQNIDQESGAVAGCFRIEKSAILRLSYLNKDKNS